MTAAVIIAAGYGRQSDGSSKLLATLNDGTPLIVQSIRNVRSAKHFDPLVVVLNHHYGPEIIKRLASESLGEILFVYQTDRLGPADAFSRAVPILQAAGATDALAVFADMPFVQPELTRAMYTAHTTDPSKPMVTISSWPFNSRHELAPYMSKYTYLREVGCLEPPELHMYSARSPADGDAILSSVYIIKLWWFVEVFEDIEPHHKGDEHPTPERHMPKLIELANRSWLKWCLNLSRDDIAEQIIGVDDHTPNSLEMVRALQHQQGALTSK